MGEERGEEPYNEYEKTIREKQDAVGSRRVREAVTISHLQPFKCRQLGVLGLLVQECPHDQTLPYYQHWSCTLGKEMSP